MTTFPGYFMLNKDVASQVNVETGAASKFVDAQQMRAALGFSKRFASAQQAITAAGALSIAHGLGVVPQHVFLVLTCVTGDLGYTAGQQIILNPALNAAASGRGLIIVRDATNIIARYSSSAGVFDVVHATTGANGNITPANWTLQIVAWG